VVTVDVAQAVRPTLDGHPLVQGGLLLLMRTRGHGTQATAP
jgi:hypothetical protein